MVDGFAVSIGTQYPEAAYELAKFMTFSADAANASYRSIIPARRSLADLEPTQAGLKTIHQLHRAVFIGEVECNNDL